MLNGAVLSSTTRSRSTRRARSSTPRYTTPLARPTRPATGGRSLPQVPCPRRLLARRRGGSFGSGCGTPFFPGVLVHLVGLGGRVGQRQLLLGGLPGQGLEAVPEFEQVLAVAAQLAGQPRGRHPLAEAAQDQQPLGAGAAGLLQCGAGEGVEHAAAGAALVVEDGGAVAAVDAQPGVGAAARAGQATRVQDGHEPLVAGAFVEQVSEGEVHDVTKTGERAMPPPFQPRGRQQSTPQHRCRPMSQYSFCLSLCALCVLCG
jgi:hypothetical protein